MPVWTFAILILSAALAALPARAASGADAVFTVGNYPVEATAGDAVTAKDKALQDGQQAAFRSLLKRLVPVKAYDRLAKMPPIKAADLVDGVGVKSERNSSTQYIASLDFSFRPAAVREILRAQGIPFVDTQAPPLVVLPVATADNAAAQTRLQRSWTTAWQGLDGAHSLTPFKIEALKGDVTLATLKPLLDGDGAVIDRLARTYGSGRILVASAQTEGGKLQVILAGQDAVGPFLLKRSFKIAGGDVDYATELASVIASGILEGRWKAVRVQSAGGLEVLAQPPVAVHLVVQYGNLQQWQDMRRRLAELPGVEDLQIGGVSARGADLALRYPGGGEAMAAMLATQGYDMRPNGGSWILRAGG
ncbi:MAG: DUF2066 domain-containing protein [Hyphomicrobiaceae bacterium]